MQHNTYVSFQFKIKTIFQFISINYICTEIHNPFSGVVFYLIDNILSFYSHLTDKDGGNLYGVNNLQEGVIEATINILTCVPSLQQIFEYLFIFEVSI